jgi:formylglycine-generating enzyme required for sulfatase activity
MEQCYCFGALRRRMIHIFVVLHFLSCGLIACCCGKKSNSEYSVADGGNDSSAPDTGIIWDSGTDGQVGENCEHPPVVAACAGGFCRIPAGCFTLGSPATEPCRSPSAESQVRIRLTHMFDISEHEVTQAEWHDIGFLKPIGPSDCPECPITYVDWFEALAYANALSANEGRAICYDLFCCEGTVGEGCQVGEPGCGETTFRCDCDLARYSPPQECPGYRLPTVAEWQYAARAGTTTATYRGDLTAAGPDCEGDPVLDLIAWHCGNTSEEQPVGMKSPNDWGLFDMLGSAWEWVDTCYSGGPLGEPGEILVDPVGPTGTPVRSIVGGSWREPPCHARAAMMPGFPPETRGAGLGFRIVRTVVDEP